LESQIKTIRSENEVVFGSVKSQNEQWEVKYLELQTTSRAQIEVLSLSLGEARQEVETFKT